MTKKQAAEKLYTTTNVSVREIGKQIKSHHSTISDWAREGKWVRPEQSIEFQITTQQEIIDRRKDALIKNLQDKNRRLINDYSELMDKYDDALLLKENHKVVIPKIVFNRSIKSEAVPIIQWSDWHIEERIEKSVTFGKNEFNPDIASKRVDKLVENTLKLVKKERQDVVISEMVVCLGGDFINNYLHDHDTQMNYMSPIEASIFVKEQLKKALLSLAKNGSLKKIIVLCIRGNHPRLTKKMQPGNDYKMNLEAVIYYMLKQELTDPIFEWHIPESELGYIKVGNTLIRAFHGQQCQYQGGIGDITVPVNKLIQKWDKTEKADFNLMHHFHRFWMPTNTCSLNGSLCGWNSYAVSKGFAYEPPIQSFQLLDKKRGLTTRIPIFCE